MQRVILKGLFFDLVQALPFPSSLLITMFLYKLFPDGCDLRAGWPRIWKRRRARSCPGPTEGHVSGRTRCKTRVSTHREVLADALEADRRPSDREDLFKNQGGRAYESPGGHEANQDG